MNKPKVSVCIPAYNGSKYLKQCIDSAIGQTYQNTEIIISDDGSTDETWNIISGYAAKDKRIKAYRNDRNLGLVGNWNKCMSLAQGEWIKFLFQDDYLDIGCIETMVQNIEAKDKLITSGRRLVFELCLDEKVKAYSLNETLTFEKLGIKPSAPVTIPAETIAIMAVNNMCMNFIGEPSVVMFKKECISDKGYFNPDISQICDLEYFLRIASTYGIKYIPQPLTSFRLHTKSTSSSQLKNKVFILRYLDPIITSGLMLYGPYFNSLRASLPARKKLKLKGYFLVHIYEARKAAGASGKENKEKFDAVGTKYPEIKKHENGNIFIVFVWLVVKLKRWLAKK